MSTNVFPNQTRSIDPFAGYNSNVVNMLTRGTTQRANADGSDCILGTHSLDIIWDGNSPSVLTVLSGECFKDDVYIKVIDNFTIDLANIDFYLSDGNGALYENGWYYIVLNYTYSISKPAPQASIKEPCRRSLT